MVRREDGPVRSDDTYARLGRAKDRSLELSMGVLRVVILLDLLAPHWGGGR